MKVLGIIPARSGSKRVPKKNIRLLAGKPLIGYTLEAALQSKYIERLVVSTDDKEIAGISVKYGAEAPFLRPYDLSADDAPDQPVFKHALDWLKKNDNYIPDVVLNLRPTTPFKTAQIIDMVVEKIRDANADIVRTMTAVNGVHHPYWMYRLSDDGEVSSFVDGIDLNDYYQSQLLPWVYRINGVVDAYRTKVIESGNILNNHNMRAVVISEEESIDIDTEFDFILCEHIFGSKQPADKIT